MSDYRQDCRNLTGKTVALGVTGSIAAYKAAELVRLLMKKGATVKVIMTQNARQFVHPLTFQTLSENPVITGMWEPISDREIVHTSLADEASIAVVAPASANIIGKYAGGIADDFLSTFLLAIDIPVLLAPAMNPRMFAHPATQSNVNILAKRGVRFAGPGAGDTACGHIGTGRMEEPEIIADHAAAILRMNGDLKGRRVLVTAGPTREPIDPVRYISNRSSGLMGYALAAAAVERGAEVVLISGPSHLMPHAAVKFIKIESAQEMSAAVPGEFANADIIIMAAAVADWRCAEAKSSKWKKGVKKTARLELVATDDILAGLSRMKRSGQTLVGFAAETGNFREEALRKLRSKNLDFIVGNDVSGADSGFESDMNSGVIIDRAGMAEELPPQKKRIMADRIFDRILAGS
jgi:phosphopantothenoylcysteine decarboxylase / phosphopantothenate---cysteine ligase